MTALDRTQLFRSTHSGESAVTLEEFKLGSTLIGQDAVFRVWAPNADAVYVYGDFNDWQPTEHALGQAEGGIWQGLVHNVQPGEGYLFRIVNGDQQLDRIDPRAREVTNSVGHGIVQAELEAPAKQLACYEINELVIYELHLGTFAVDDDGNGSFDTAISKLDHLVEMGVTAVEVMPVAEFAGDISWGYNPAHPFAVESAYGGPAALRRFIEACHDRKLAVIMDVVYNHFGPSDLDLWRFDGWGESDANGASYGGIYFYNDWRAHTPWGATRPDYGRAEVRDYILDNVRMWVEEYGVDGLRLDMTLYIRHVNGDGSPNNNLPDGWTISQAINDYCATCDVPIFTFAEDLRSDAALTRPTGDGGAGFRSQWDEQFVHPVRAMLMSPSDEDRRPSHFRSILEARYDDDPFNRVIYTESHDEVANGQTRMPAEIDETDPTGEYAVRKSSFGVTLLMTVPGVPMLFQGQEMLETHWFDDTKPLDWKRKQRFDGLYQLFCDVTKLRSNREGLTAGLTGGNVRVLFEHDDRKVLAWHRWKDGGVNDDCVVVANFGAQPQSDVEIAFPSGGRWALRFNGDTNEYGDEFGGHEAWSVKPQQVEDRWIAKVRVGAYSCLIFSLEATGEPVAMEARAELPADEDVESEASLQVVA